MIFDEISFSVSNEKIDMLDFCFSFIGMKYLISFGMPFV